MNRFIRTLVTLAWGLWLGGLVMLFIALQSLFDTFSARRDLAGEAASGMFRRFAFYRLGLAAAALGLTFLWRIADKSRATVVAFSFFTLATLAAVYSVGVLTPQIERLRMQSQTHSAQFTHLHALSMGVYLLETLFVFCAGLTLHLNHGADKQTRASQLTGM